MKSQDIVILLKLISLHDQSQREFENSKSLFSNDDDPYSVRGLGASLGISKTEISASLNRSLDSGLAMKDRHSGRPKANARHLCDLITHGLKFVFPVKPGAPERGIPTGFAAPMLKGDLISGGDDIYVWPDARGKERGLSVEPLFKSVPDAVRNDERLYEYLALIDAIRLGKQRESSLAAEYLRERLLSR